MRLFIAVNFDEGTKQNIIDVQKRLRERVKDGNFSRPENLHLTLAFLGEVAENRVFAAAQAMQQVAVQPLTLTFDHVGCFQRDSGDIWWIGLQENQALLNMQKELCEHLSARGFPLESRRFSPHITLARQVRLCEPIDRKDLLGTPFVTRTDAISMMLSERVNGRLTYTEQYTVRADSSHG